MGAAHPDRTLARGFSIVRGEDGLVVRGVPAAGSTLQIETATAQIDATVARAEARPRPTPEATSPESTDPGPASEEQQ